MLFGSNRMRDKQNLMPRMTGAFKYYTLIISTKTIRKNIGKIDGSYINTPAGKYYGGRYTDIQMYACSEKCIPAVQCFGYFHIL